MEVCDKNLFYLQILEAIDYIDSVSKNKPTKERIQKNMARSNLELQEEALQSLTKNLEKEGIQENHGDFKKSLESYMEKMEKELEIIDSIEDDDRGTLILEFLHRYQIKYLWRCK